MKKKSVLPLLCVGALLGSCSPKENKQTQYDFTAIDKRVDSVMQLMTLDEKIGQLVLLSSDWDVTGPTIKANYQDDIRQGRCGNVFNAHTAKFTRELQRVAVEESRMKIPLLFGYDVIHGHRTIFPISLGESASWDLSMIEEAARVSAIEASAGGLHWTFAPMCDVSVDPRWGRVSEGAGEDPYLGSRIAEARVVGYQGKENNLADPSTVLACVKHFAAYGAPIAGRDYNTVDMSERVFRSVYLRPYKAAVDAGALSVMTSFNELDGVPATANKRLMTDILRDEWGFQGFVVTDYTAINECVHHGVAADDAEAGALAIRAGVDMDMQGEVYFKYLKDQVEEGVVDKSLVDESCRRILRLKFMLGLFDDPYRYCDEEREAAVTCSAEHLDASYRMAVRSMVLLKNENEALPLIEGEKVAVIGELANSTRDMLGSWKAAGEWDKMTTVLDEIRLYNGASNVLYAEGCKKMGDDRSGFAQALAAARRADKVVMVIGEDWDWSGEAASRTDIRVPGVQTELLEQIARLGKPVVVVLMNGRPLDLSREATLATSILEAWYPGTMGGKAVTDVLFGEYNPSGKLSMTFPRTVGQVPIFYYEKNTGRPIYLPSDKYKSKYIDSPNTPLYPFGYGLSYTKFDYSELTLSAETLTATSPITISVMVTNNGKYDGEEVVQLYVRDLIGSVTRPVKELVNFQKVMLKKGQKQKITFTLSADELAFYRQDMSFGTEAGDYHLFVGGSSDSGMKSNFTLK